MMSRAFTKEIDERPEEVLPRPVSVHPNCVTSNGLTQIERALEKYEAAHSAAISKENKTVNRRPTLTPGHIVVSL